MVNISVQTLSDAIARYSVKSDPSSTSTHNNVPKTVVTTTSAIVSAFRRIHGTDPPDGSLGDMTWLTLAAVKSTEIRGRHGFEANGGDEGHIDLTFLITTFSVYVYILCAEKW